MFQDALSPDQENLDLANVNLMLELLVQKKKQLEAVRNAPGIIEFCLYHSLLWVHSFVNGWTIVYVKNIMMIIKVGDIYYLILQMEATISLTECNIHTDLDNNGCLTV